MSSNIIRILAQKQWSQRRLARESGLDPVYVNRIINEKKDIRISTAHRLARALNCRIDEMFPAVETADVGSIAYLHDASSLGAEMLRAADSARTPSGRRSTCPANGEVHMP